MEVEFRLSTSLGGYLPPPRTAKRIGIQITQVALDAIAMQYQYAIPMSNHLLVQVVLDLA